MPVLLSAAEAPVLSKSAQKAQERYNAKLEKIMSDMQEDIDEAREQFITDLNKEYKVLMRKGDLTAVQLLQKRIDNLGAIGSKDLMGNDIASGGKKNGLTVSVITDDKKGSGIVIIRALAQRSGKKDIDVKEDLQSFLDTGKISVVPAQDLFEATGIRRSARLKVTFVVRGKEHMRVVKWKKPLVFIEQ